MRRTVTTAAVLAALLAAPLAVAQPPLLLQVEQRSAPARTPALGGREALMRQWAGVGRCVVGHDRVASLAFVRAEIGSDDASLAAQRLDPVFASCLAGSRVPGPSSLVLRRAAVANALGIVRTSI